jgi:hypothetical protein
MTGRVRLRDGLKLAMMLLSWVKGAKFRSIKDLRSVISTMNNQRTLESLTTMEQYPSEDVSTRESPAGDLGKARHISSALPVYAHTAYQATSVNAE